MVTTIGNSAVRNLRIILTNHAERRLRCPRQEGITADDVLSAARSIPWICYNPVRFRHFVSRSGKPFAIVIRDLAEVRLVITVIGGK